MLSLHPRTFSALVYFEACGRLLSFSEAAKELCITTGAISQQIRKLEEQLGSRLFLRHPSGIRLTNEGEELLMVSRQSIEALKAVINRLQERQSEQVVRLKSTPSFVFKWLIPRLQAFHLQFPEIRIETYADAALLELAGGDFDLAIDYSEGKYQEFESELLVDEQLLPVISPEYMKDEDWQDPAIWRRLSLLHDAMPWLGAERDAEWRYWFSQRGLTPEAGAQAHYFNRSDMAIAAAEAGLGVAVARSSLIAAELSSGRLISPFPAVSSCCDYYLLTPKYGTVSKSTKVLKDWLLEQI